MTVNSSTSVIATIVAYYPDLETLAAFLPVLFPQVDHVIVLDNSPSSNLDEWAASNFPGYVLTVNTPGENLGVAAGHNVCIRLAKELGASHVITFDQDSVPDANLVSDLLDGLKALQNKGINVAAVGPKVVDPLVLKSLQTI